MAVDNSEQWFDFTKELREMAAPVYAEFADKLEENGFYWMVFKQLERSHYLTLLPALNEPQAILIEDIMNGIKVKYDEHTQKCATSSAADAQRPTIDPSQFEKKHGRQKSEDRNRVCLYLYALRIFAYK